MCTAGLAPVIGSVIGGWVYQRVGPPELFVGSAVGLTVAVAIVWLATTGLSRHVAMDRADDDPDR
jgi:hypothetical protein